VRYGKLNNPGGLRRGWWERRRLLLAAFLLSRGQWRVELKVRCCSFEGLR